MIVTNTLPLKRSDLVSLSIQLPDASDSIYIFDSEGHEIPVQIVSRDQATHTYKLLTKATVPALGYTVLHADSVAPPSKATTPRQKLMEELALKPMPDIREFPDYFLLRDSNSTGALRVKIDKKTGCITDLTFGDWAPYSFFAPNTCANQLQTYADNPKQYDAWNIDPGTLDGKMTPIDTLDSIKVVADGPLRKTIEIKRTWQHSHFTQDISLDAGSDFVRVDTTVDWHEQHVLLKAAFPLAASGPKATFEIPYGAIERSTTRNNSWEKAQFEVPALRWADLGDATQGVSILNDSKYGYDAVGNTLRLTLLRSPTWPDPDADQGPQHFTYEIYPHTGPWQTAQTVHRGYELNTPLTAQQVFPHTGSLPPTHSFASIDEPTSSSPR